MKVSCLFRVFGDGDSETTFGLEGVFSSAEKAINEVKIPEFYLELGRNGKPKIDFSHESMSMEKPYYIGKRADCKEETSYGHFGGFVIEENEVK